MKIFLTVILLFGFTTGSALAAPYELKGYHLGMTLAEFKQAFQQKNSMNQSDAHAELKELSAKLPRPGKSLSEYTKEDRKKLDALLKDARPQKNHAGPFCYEEKGAVVCGPLSREQSRAGIKSSLGGGPATLLYNFAAESDQPGQPLKLFLIAASIDAENFKTIGIALEEKYGPAHFPGPQGKIWQAGNATMILSKDGKSIKMGDKPALIIIDSVLAKKLEQRKNKMLAQKALADM